MGKRPNFQGGWRFFRKFWIFQLYAAIGLQAGKTGLRAITLRASHGHFPPKLLPNRPISNIQALPAATRIRVESGLDLW